MKKTGSKNCYYCFDIMLFQKTIASGNYGNIFRERIRGGQVTAPLLLTKYLWL